MSTLSSITNQRINSLHRSIVPLSTEEYITLNEVSPKNSTDPILIAAYGENSRADYALSAIFPEISSSGGSSWNFREANGAILGYSIINSGPNASLVRNGISYNPQLSNALTIGEPSFYKTFLFKGRYFTVCSDHFSLLYSDDKVHWTPIPVFENGLDDLNRDSSLFEHDGELFVLTYANLYSLTASGWQIVCSTVIPPFYGFVSNGSTTLIIYELGSSDIRVTTDKGATWTVVTHPQGAYTWTLGSMGWNGEVFYTISGSYLHTSLDGLSWNSTDVTASISNVYKVVKFGSTQIAIGSITQTYELIYSTDNCVSWTSVMPVPELNWELCIQGNTVSLVTWEGFIYSTSTDGVSWVAMDPITEANRIYSDSSFQITSTTSQLQISFDSGVTFEDMVLSGPFQGFLEYVNSFWFYEGTYYADRWGDFYSSKDLTYWKQNPALSYSYLSKVVNKLGVLVATHQWGASRFSRNGLDWTDIAGLVFYTVAHNGEIFCAACMGSDLIYTSTDGENWSSQSIGKTLYYTVIAWNGQVFHLSDQYDNTAFTSLDGITWTQRASPLGATIYTSDVVALGNRFIAVQGSVESGKSAKIAHSTNGVDWTVVEVLPPNPMSHSAQVKVIATSTEVILITDSAYSKILVSNTGADFDQRISPITLPIQFDYLDNGSIVFTNLRIK